MPDNIQPMLASSGELPADVARWALEVKWDGVRAIVYVADGHVRVVGRRGIDATSRYPELQTLADLLPDQTAVIDGEVVAFDSEGRPSFERLQARMHIGPPQHPADPPGARALRRLRPSLPGRAHAVRPAVP